MKTYFDRRVRGQALRVGQTVWLYWPRPLVKQKHRKLTQLWTGPWVVERFFSTIVVEISHPLAQKRQTVHVDRLVPCLAPTENPAPEVESEPATEPHYVPILPPIYGPTADAGDVSSPVKNKGRTLSAATASLQLVNIKIPLYEKFYKFPKFQFLFNSRCVLFL